MILFFRKIRKKLADQDQFTKYARYAFGEIVLVVIGILIALQINNWYQFRIDRKSEKNIYKDLREELQTNKAILNNAMVRRNAIYKPLENYMAKLLQGRVDYTDFIELHENSFFSGHINPSFGVVNTLISSGDVNLISNDSLKYLLTDWKDYIALFMSVEAASFQGHRRFSEFFDTRFPAKGNRYHHMDPEELQGRFREIYRDVEYVNRLITVEEHFQTALNLGKDVNNYLDRMINLIDIEIKKLD